jgi:hypothetical protein
MVNQVARAGASALLAGLILAGLAVPARGIINPNFTPCDLVRGADQIFLLKVHAPDGKAVAAEVVETLKGKPPAAKELKLDFSEAAELPAEAVAAPFAGAKTAAAVLVLSKDAQKDSGDTPVGALQIDTLWFAVLRQGGQWRLEQDKQELFSVWAGSAPLLAEAARYVLADPAADFPVRSAMSWGSDVGLGKLAGKARGAIVADFGKPIGLAAVVLADGGDRVYQAASAGGKPADVTAKLRLATASKVAATGDFDGDGRTDLASWDGKSLRLALQAAGGTFSVREAKADLADCLSLDSLRAGSAAGAGLVAGTAKGPMLLVPDGQGGFAVRPLAEAPPAEAADLGSGGLCVVADFDADGRPDVLQVLSKGTLFYGAEGPGRFKAPVKAAVPLVKGPRVAVCGDYDADGALDVVVAGEDGLALVTRAEVRRWQDLTAVTGELAYHGNANRPEVVGAAPCDPNSDGRQGVALFYPNRNPLVFFNRGFACFGLARELELSGSGSAMAEMPDPFAEAKPKLAGADALQGGQTAGTVLDLNGDGLDDLLAAGLEGDVWALCGKRDDQPVLLVTLALPPKALDPVTVTVRQKGRRLGMHVVRPGGPAFVGRTEPGPLTLEWPGPDGKPITRQVIVEGSMRVELAP